MRIGPAQLLRTIMRSSRRAAISVGSALADLLALPFLRTRESARSSCREPRLVVRHRMSGHSVFGASNPGTCLRSAVLRRMRTPASCAVAGQSEPHETVVLHPMSEQRRRPEQRTPATASAGQIGHRHRHAGPATLLRSRTTQGPVPVPSWRLGVPTTHAGSEESENRRLIQH